MLSQGEPRDAAVNFNRYRILQRRHAVSLPQHGFLRSFLYYRPTPATVQMLKLQTACWFSRPWRKIKHDHRK